MSNLNANTEFPLFVSAGDILTDLVRTGASQWLSRPGGAGWNVARCVARLGLPTACAGSLGVDNFSDELWNASVAAGLDMRFMQRVERPPLLAIVHQTHPPAYFFMGENGADLAFDPARLPAGWIGQVKWAHFGCISLVRQPLGDYACRVGRRVALARREDQFRSELPESDGARLRAHACGRWPRSPI